MSDPVQLDAIRSLEALGGRDDPDARRKVAREFEALLVGEMTKLAHKPVFGETLLDGGSSARMWQELYLEQVVRAGSGRFGIASQLEASLPAGDRDRAAPTDGTGPQDRSEEPK